MSEKDDIVRLETRGNVAVVTMLRSARRNAMDQALVDGLKATLLQLDRDDNVSAIVLVGAAPGFSAGSCGPIVRPSCRQTACLAGPTCSSASVSMGGR